MCVHTRERDSSPGFDGVLNKVLLLLLNNSHAFPSILNGCLDGQESKIVTCLHLMMKISGFLITKILITVYCLCLHRLLHQE